MTSVLQKCIGEALSPMHALRRRVLLRAIEALIHGHRLTQIDVDRCAARVGAVLVIVAGGLETMPDRRSGPRVHDMPKQCVACKQPRDLMVAIEKCAGGRLLMSWRRATCETNTVGSRLSSTIRRLFSTENRRC